MFSRPISAVTIFVAAGAACAAPPTGIQQVEQVEHRLAISALEHRVRLAVARVFCNLGDAPAEISYAAPISSGAVIRDVGVAVDGTQESITAIEIDELDLENRGSGPPDGSRPSVRLMTDAASTAIFIQSTPLQPTTCVEVAYILEVEARYGKGTRYVDYEYVRGENVVIDTAGSGASIEFGEYSHRPNEALVHLSAPHFEPDARATVRSALLSAPSGTPHHLERFAFTAPSTLAPWPEQMRFIFLLDASRSMQALGRRAQLTVAESIVSAVSDAEVQVLIFSRTVEPLFEDFVPGVDFAAAIASIDDARLVQKNGSDAARALAATARWLDERPARVIIVTDDWPDPVWVPTAIPSSTQVHVVEWYDYEEPGAALMALPADRCVLAEGGTCFTLNGSPEQARGLEDLAHLVAPQWIDDVSVTVGEGDAARKVTDLGTIGAGQTQSASIVTREPTAEGAELTGRIWNKRTGWRLIVEPAEASDLIALLRRDVSEETIVLDGAEVIDVSIDYGDFMPDDGVSFDLHMQIAAKHNALSHEAAIITDDAAWDLGPAPTRPRRIIQLDGFSCATGLIEIQRFSAREPVRTLLEQAKSSCGAADLAVRVTLHRGEVYDVRIEDAPNPAAACVEDTLWSAEAIPFTSPYMDFGSQPRAP